MNQKFQRKMEARSAYLATPDTWDFVNKRIEELGDPALMSSGEHEDVWRAYAREWAQRGRQFADWRKFSKPVSNWVGTGEPVGREPFDPEMLFEIDRRLRCELHWSAWWAIATQYEGPAPDLRGYVSFQNKLELSWQRAQDAFINMRGWWEKAGLEFPEGIEGVERRMPR